MTPRHLAAVPDRRRTPRRPPRQPRNGHHPDCPYPTQDAHTCPICQGIAKGSHQEER